MFWTVPIGENFNAKQPTDLDLILKWYERNCPERTVHINTGIEMQGDLDYSIKSSNPKYIKQDIFSATQSYIACSVYICKTSGPDKGPKHDWPCDYIDAWGQSSAFDASLLDT